MNIVQRIFLEPLEKSLEKIIAFLPNLLTSLFLLIAGVIIALIIKIIFAKVCKTIGLDRYASRVGFVELLKKAGITDLPSVLLAKFVGGIIFLVFLILSMSALQVMAVEHLLERLLLYLPNIFVAALILIFGYLLGNFFGRAALIASVNAGVQFSGILGGAVKFTILILSATMALEHVGIGKETMHIAFAIIFGGFVLALVLAFGLGGKELAKEYLMRKIKGEREENENGIHHI